MYPNNIEEILKDVNKLENFIVKQSELYYSDGSQILTDSEFDKLTEELERLKPDSEILKKVGWGSEENSKGKIKVEHMYTEVGSLTKTRVYEEIPEIFKQDEVCISPKLDGLTMTCYYKNGKLDVAVTRGNGKVGIDKTNKMIQILKNKNINLPEGFTGGIRGELLISKSNWEVLKSTNQDANNSRNFAAGLVNRDDCPDELKYLDFVTYKVLGDTERRFNSKSQVVEFLNDCGFDTIYNIKTKISDNWQEWAEDLYKSDYPYQLDGLVMSLEDIRYNDRSGIEYTEFAYKFESEQVWSKVIDITYTLSKNNRLIPTIQIEPTEILETVVRNITGNNCKWILDHDICIGKEVLVEKANEIIPQIREVR